MLYPLPLAKSDDLVQLLFWAVVVVFSLIGQAAKAMQARKKSRDGTTPRAAPPLAEPESSPEEELRQFLEGLSHRSVTPAAIVPAPAPAARQQGTAPARPPQPPAPPAFVPAPHLVRRRQLPPDRVPKVVRRSAAPPPPPAPALAAARTPAPTPAAPPGPTLTPSGIATDSAHPAGLNPIAADLRRRVAAGPQALRDAVVLREVLGIALALRPPQGVGAPGGRG